MRKRVVVGKNDNSIRRKRFFTVAEAEAHIAKLWSIDPKSIESGEYYIDAPEELINPPKGKK